MEADEIELEQRDAKFNVDGGLSLHEEVDNQILAFCTLDAPHTGMEIAKKILSCLKDWGIEKTIFSLTLDNASANDSIQDVLKHQLSLQNSLLCKGSAQSKMDKVRSKMYSLFEEYKNRFGISTSTSQESSLKEKQQGSSHFDIREVVSTDLYLPHYLLWL